MSQAQYCPATGHISYISEKYCRPAYFKDRNGKKWHNCKSSGPQSKGQRGLIPIPPRRRQRLLGSVWWAAASPPSETNLPKKTTASQGRDCSRIKQKMLHQQTILASFPLASQTHNSYRNLNKRGKCLAYLSSSYTVTSWHLQVVCMVKGFYLAVRDPRNDRAAKNGCINNVSKKTTVFLQQSNQRRIPRMTSWINTPPNYNDSHTEV